MDNQHEGKDRPEIIFAPSRKLPSGEIITLSQGPPPGGHPRPGHEAEFLRAERLITAGINNISPPDESREEARRWFDAATKLLASALGPDRRLAFALDRLGYVNHLLGNDDEAETCYLRSLEIHKRTGQKLTAWNEVTLLNLAILYRDTGRPELNRAALLGYDPAQKPYFPGIRSREGG